VSNSVITKPDKDKDLYFYTNLEQYMKERELSIAELSDQSKVAQSTIRSLIRGKLKRLDSISAGKLIRFFGCTLEDLYVTRWE